MPAFLKFFELLALAVWTGGLVHDRWLSPPSPHFPKAAIASCATLALAQVGRGVIWTWSGMTTPALALFAILLALCAWRTALTRSLAVLAVLLAYTAWIANRGW